MTTTSSSKPACGRRRWTGAGTRRRHGTLTHAVSARHTHARTRARQWQGAHVAHRHRQQAIVSQRRRLLGATSHRSSTASASHATQRGCRGRRHRPPAATRSRMATAGGARARIEDSDVPWDGCSTSQVFHVIGLIAARHDAVIHAFIGRSPSGSPARCTTGEGFFATFLWAKCALATNQPMRRSLRPMWSTSVLKGRSLRSLRCLVSSLSTNMTAIDEKSEAHGWHHP